MSKLKKTILASLLLAVTIVLSRFLSINTPILTINFAFLPIMLSAILLGPFYSTLIAGLSDLIGALLFPFGAYFVGYTISSALAGLIYGLLLYSSKKEFTKKQLIIRLTISSFLVLLICNTVLNTLWIYITTKKALFAILPVRLLKQLIMLPIQVVTLSLIYIGLKKAYPAFFKRGNDDIIEEIEEDKTTNIENNDETKVISNDGIVTNNDSVKDESDEKIKNNKEKTTDNTETNKTKTEKSINNATKTNVTKSKEHKPKNKTKSSNKSTTKTNMEA